MAKMLRDTYFAEDKFKTIFRELKDREEKMQGDLAEVRTELKAKLATIEDIERCTIENLKADMRKVTEMERSRFSNMLYFDDTYLLEMEERHGRLLADWTPLVNRLHNDVSFFKTRGIGLKFDSKGQIWANEPDSKSYATKEATVTWTDQDKQLYTKLGELVDLITEIRGIRTINYSHCLKWTLTDRHAPKYASVGQLLGEVKGLSITPEKYYKMKEANFGATFPQQTDSVI